METLPFELVCYIFEWLDQSNDWWCILLTCKRFQVAAEHVFDPTRVDRFEYSTQSTRVKRRLCSSDRTISVMDRYVRIDRQRILIEACRHDDVTMVRHLLSKRVDPSMHASECLRAALVNDASYKLVSLLIETDRVDAIATALGQYKDDWRQLSRPLILAARYQPHLASMLLTYVERCVVRGTNRRDEAVDVLHHAFLMTFYRTTPPNDADASSRCRIEWIDRMMRSPLFDGAWQRHYLLVHLADRRPWLWVVRKLLMRPEVRVDAHDHLALRRALARSVERRQMNDASADAFQAVADTLQAACVGSVRYDPYVCLTTFTQQSHWIYFCFASLHDPPFIDSSATPSLKK